MTNNLRKYLKPNSLSPDVFTGGKWKEYVKLWRKLGVDPNDITCMPSEDNALSSAEPTAVGVVATTETISTTLLPGMFASKKFLMEGFGGVGSNAVRLLMTEHEVPAENITVIDPNKDACIKARTMGVSVIQGEANKYYRSLTDSKNHFDIWINNGVGDTVGLAEVIHLLNSGVKIFVGGANNLFLVTELEILLDLIAQNKAFAFPDYACSGGGWLMAVLEQIRKATGNPPVDVLKVIKERNVKMAKDFLDGFSVGMDLWQTVAVQADLKIQNALSQHSKLTEADFLIENWKL